MSEGTFSHVANQIPAEVMLNVIPEDILKQVRTSNLIFQNILKV